MDKANAVGKLFNSVGGGFNFLVICLVIAFCRAGKKFLDQFLEESKTNSKELREQTKEIQKVVDNNTSAISRYTADLKKHGEESKKSFDHMEEKFDEIEEKLDITQRTAENAATKEMVAEIGEDIKAIKKDLKHS